MISQYLDGIALRDGLGRSLSYRTMDDMIGAISEDLLRAGFVGRHILQRLIDDANVSRIHCGPTRERAQNDPIRRIMEDIVVSSFPKVMVHTGNLEAPRLGLSETDFAN